MCSVDVAARIPEACTRDAGVDKLNCAKFERVASGAIFSLTMCRDRQFARRGMRGRIHIHGKADLSILGRSFPERVHRAGGRSCRMKPVQGMRRQIQSRRHLSRGNISQPKMHSAAL